MVNALDCNILVIEFKLQSPYLVHFPINTPEEDMNHIISPQLRGGLNSTTSFFKKDLWNEITHESLQAIKERN